MRIFIHQAKKLTKSNFRRAFLSGAIFVLLLSANGFSRQESYRVGIYQNEPYVFVDSGGKTHGICVEILEEIASREKWQIEYVLGSWPEVYEKIITGEIDILLAIAYDKKRESLLRFTSETLLITWARIYVKRGSDIKSMVDLDHRVIAVQEDDIYARNMIARASDFGLNCSFVVCRDYFEVFRKVESNEADAGVVDRVFGKIYWQAEDLEETAIVLSPIEVRVALRKDAPEEFQDTFDRHIKEMIYDTESVLHQSIERYMTMGSEKGYRYSKVRHLLYSLLTLVFAAISLVYVRKARKNRMALSEKAVELERESLDRHEVERALGLSEEKYRNLFESSPYGITIIGFDGTLIDSNRAAADLVGVGWKEYIGNDIGSVLPLKRHLPLIRKKIKEIRESDLKDLFELEIIPSGRTDSRTLNVHVSAIEQDGKRVVLAIFSDITQKKMLEERVLQMQKMESIGTLAGGIAHGFNNLLTGILGYSNMLKMDRHDDKEVLKAVEVIEKSAERASRLTSQLVGFAREGKHFVQPVDMQRVINDVLSMMEKTLDRNIRVEMRFEAEHMIVSGDPTQLEQVILNLSLNARDAMASGGKLLVRTGNVDLDKSAAEANGAGGPGRYLVIEVEDTGYGIPKQIQARVFDPFFTTKQKRDGTGMGLAMVYGILVNHGGSISVESEEGMGATFRVLLPVDENATSDARETKTIIPLTGRGRIVVVDDEEIVLKVTRGMLLKLGYEVNIFQDCQEAIGYFKDNHDEIDLVIIDLVMPGMDGAEFFRKVKEIDPDVKTILSSGFILDERAQKLLDEGMNGFIQKPFGLTQFSRAVAKILGFC